MTSAERINALIENVERIRDELVALRAEGSTGDGPAKLAEYMTLEEYAKRRRVSRATIYKWRALGMPVDKRGRTARVPVRDADAWDYERAIARHAEVAASGGRR